ncbi:low molecular weight protein-tyrosine-phosphatase [Variovorax sp. J2P1-59]|uniref:low molecular weight protein-tyrosine-phosphatase n=1 Tax=Variovorax flavidus TaxID=3053501 RepID=UPI002577CB6F|nr:low molecular weight protein-tyrosine-phosphatase [Variovorax sp. J2P1-59]MDM0073088.1 low molecular weight protein-tyrosine-phosphatase [Variovorax sp. J2P1-59]
MLNILVVCVGNICRSPLGEAFMARDLPQAKVWSAGLGALVGAPADPLSVEVGAAHGLDLSAHRAQQITGWMCQAAELILVMEQRHKTDLEQRYPLVRGKLFRLGDRGGFDIVDPYRQPKAAFETACADIARGAADWVARIRQIA